MTRHHAPTPPEPLDFTLRDEGLGTDGRRRLVRRALAALALLLLTGCGQSVVDGARQGWLKFKSGGEVFCERGLEHVLVRGPIGEPMAWLYRCRQTDGDMTFSAFDVEAAKFIR